jgi:hypothetical protein
VSLEYDRVLALKSPPIYMLLSLLETIQEFIQERLDAKLVVSNHHPKCLTMRKITMIEILSKSDADPSHSQPLNGDLIYNL